MKLTLYARSLAAVAPCMAKKDVRYYLNGVLLERLPKSGGLCAVATNGHMIAIARDENTPWPYEKPLIVPRDAVEQLLKLAKGDEAIELERVTVAQVEDGSSDYWTASVSGHTFPFREIDGRFPDYQACIPRNLSGDEAVFDPALLAHFVKAAADLKRRGVAGRWVGIKLVGNGVDRSAGINLYGMVREGFSVGGVIMPLHEPDQHTRETFMHHLTAA